jgi:DinB superfamily
MDAQEKKKMLHDLERGKHVLVDSLASVSEEAAVRLPSPGKWSVLECVEHLAASKDYLFVASNPTHGPMVNRSRESVILERGLDSLVGNGSRHISPRDSSAFASSR